MNKLNIHQFFNMLLALNICNEDNMIFEPYEQLGREILELYMDGVDWMGEL